MNVKEVLRDFLPSSIVQLHDKLYYAYMKAFPQRHAAFLYQQQLGRVINWKNPTEFNEKGRWIQFYTDTSQWSLLADKYRVREYVKHNGCADILVDLYGMWETASDIDFEVLPNRFVLKTNHGCGEVIVVKDKNSINQNEIREKVQSFLDTPYGVWTAEPHYLKIKPCVIAEQLLENTCKESSSMVDYKIYCSFGKPFLIAVCYDRDVQRHRVYQTWYDISWKKRDDYHSGNYKTKEFPRPQTLDQMYATSYILANKFPFVRMDYYEVNGKMYFGEMTFTSAAFSGDELTDEARLELGNEIDLNKIPKQFLL